MEGTYGKIEFDGECAIKYYKNTKEQFHSIIREIYFLHILKHPNIVELKSIIFNSGEQISIVMPKYTPFVEYWKSNICAEDAKRIISQLVEVISFIHSKNVMHRDIKEQNLLIDSNGDLKLCDFGISRYCNMQNPDEKIPLSNLTSTTTTYSHRAPEIYELRPYTKNIDIWSLGITIFYITTRRSLYKLFSRTIRNPTHEEMEQNFKIAVLSPGFFLKVAHLYEKYKIVDGYKDIIIECLKTRSINGYEPKTKVITPKQLDMKQNLYLQYCGYLSKYSFYGLKLFLPSVEELSKESVLFIAYICECLFDAKELSKNYIDVKKSHYNIISSLNKINIDIWS